jgi:cytochrome b
MVSVAVHLAGVAVMSWRWRENLPAAMLSGRKRPQAAVGAGRDEK